MSMTISILGGVGGAFWGAVVTLLVQSSSATTMTTIAPPELAGSSRLSACMKQSHGRSAFTFSLPQVRWSSATEPPCE